MKHSLKMMTTMLVLSIAFLILTAAQTAQATTLTVDTIADDAALTACTDAANDCSLRGAVSSAPAGTTITFSVTGTITLTGGEIGIAKDLTIIGAASAPGITISGNYASRIFTVTSGTVNLSTLTLSGGNGRSVIFDSNFGAAVYNSGGTLTIANSTLTGNSVQYNGGAVFNRSKLIVVNSTFSGNSSSGNSGGAIYSYNATLIVANSTFSGNRVNSTGGAIWSSGTLDISNTIVAGNSAGSCPDLFSDTAATGDYNLVQTANNTIFNAKCAAFSTNHNITGQPASLAALADNGGPTATMALLQGSFAVNSGDPNFDTAFNPYDQRGAGFPRKNSSAIDIGAFESAFISRPPVATNTNLYFYLNTASSAQLTASSGGDAGGALTYSIVTGTLPNGLTLDPATGIISGTTTAYSTSTITFKATDSNGVQSNTATAIINVVETPSLVVNTSSDTTANDGVTSLREAVAYANSGSAGANPVITFSVTGTIEIKAPSLSISRDMTINGPGASSLILSGNGNDTGTRYNASLFNISGGIVGINGLTLRDGTGESVNSSTYGGAIYMSGGTATVSGTTLSNNNYAQNGGAIYIRGGSLTVTNSTISGNNITAYNSGGGIYEDGGSVTITNSTISGNTAGFGAGILSARGTLSLTNSTVSNNTAANYAQQTTITCNSFYECQNPPQGFTCVPGYIPSTCTGYVYYNGSAAGIFNKGGAVTITNSTISGNNALGYYNNVPVAYDYGGGGVDNRSALTVADSTITNNSGESGGGIINRGTLNLSNSIVAGNRASRRGADISNDPNSSTLGNYNLVQNGDAVTGTNNITGQDAKLGALANNGGPTQTHALLEGSPAIDAGDPNFNSANLPYDQRGAGFPRVLNGRVDIGAYEGFVYQNNLVVNTLDDHDDGFCAQSDCTLREAVKYTAAGATVTFSVSGTITLTQGEIVLVKNVSITGPTTAPGVTISGNNQSRIFSVGSTSGANTLNLSNLTLTKGNGVGTAGSGIGGAIYGSGTLNVANCTFYGNTAIGNGGAIRNSSTLTVTNSTFYGNTATGSGGAIHFGSGATITNSTISGNTATGNGGGGINNNGTTSTSAVILSNNIIAGNSAATGPDINGKVTSGDYNLIQNTAGATLPTGSTHNITGQSPLLGALANNGGATQTMALLLGSPAIDAGDPNFNVTATPFDQRGAGFARKVGNAIDIGAFEVQPVTAPTDLTITKTHTGNFTQGDTGKTYTIMVANSGETASSGTVSVTDTLPAGLTATAIGGTGWNCDLTDLTCTRNDALAASGNYPAINLTVNVASNASSLVTNTAAVSGGSETNTSNNTASDPTAISAAPRYLISGTVRYGITPSGQPDSFVSGVNLSATGTASASATSDGSGIYQLSNLSGGDYTVTPSKIGDINGINSLDATRIQQHLVGMTTLSANQLVAADTDGNGVVNSLDATRIQQSLIGMQTANIIGQWKFVPGNRQYNALSGNQTGQDFAAILVGEVSGNWASAAFFGNIFPGDGNDENAEKAMLFETSNQNQTVERFNEHSFGQLSAVTKQPSDLSVSEANAAVDIQVSLPTGATASTGSTVTIPITISQIPAGQSIESFDFSVFYDPAILQPTLTPGSNAGTLSANCSVLSFSPVSGRVIVSGACAQAITSGSGVLYNLTFTVTGAANQTSSLSFTNPATNTTAFQFNNGTPTVATANGSFTVLGTTAAGVSVSGRVLTPEGRGLTNAVVTMIDSTGAMRYARSSTFGYFHFEDVAVGQTCVFQIKSKRYTFAPQILTILDNVTELNFTAQ